MSKFVRDNSLSVVLLSLFAVFIVSLALTGHAHENEQLKQHNQPQISLSSYLVSSSFGEAVFENWESEFLQMAALVILTIWLKQKGSADSKKMRGKDKVDTHSRYSILSANSWKSGARGVREIVYGNSLSIALVALFLVSFLLHGVTGAAAANEEALRHGEQAQTVAEYMMSSQFWFESFQNWQSEFLAVGLLLVLSIFLRQRGSPESKPVGEKNSTTGNK